MIIPWQDLDPATLENIVETVILREGTDYGMEEMPFERKKQNLLAQIRNGRAVVIWSELHETIDIKNKKDFFNRNDKER